MLSTTIQKITQEFIKGATESARVVNAHISDLTSKGMYSQEYIETETAKIETVGAEVLRILRNKAIKDLSVHFTNARATIEASITENANSVELDELKNILEASGGNLSDFEISVILEKIAGNYWALRMLNNAVADTSDAKKILMEKFSAPDPVYYMDLLAEEQNYLESFINTFDGKELGTGGNAETMGEILMSGDHFAHFHERLEVNPLYITDGEIEALNLRSSERRTLRKAGITLDVTDKASRQLVVEAVQSNNPLRNILIRTVWSGVVETEEKRMKDELLDDAQIAWGGVGKSVFSTL